ncbi:group II intron reverse transcriptase domain-containing protein [Undibacterium seohonense]|uniref:Group II intron reverse transcriptase domain-containing protein n=1 Tax=Undibacterium seohonense TaxID=1344950 RepID=A0ABR6X8U0_9BURK|nr:antiviral reverse transcriptase Drt2 [Undibacterium seohonense]MBC3809261.1 group II intron reverse transcriptase domain-containing protein [Undibacterium seohonense]
MFKKKHPWFRRRGYPHFDQQIHFDKAKRIVCSPSQVARHSFYPFITFDVETVKVKQNRKTGKIEKQPPKKRSISYASHVDSHIYAYYSLQLSKQYEAAIDKYGLNECVIAFRSLGKSNIQFAAEAFDEVKKRKNCHVLCLDITGFFDNLDHQLLKSAWARLLQLAQLPDDHYAIFKSLTRYAKVDRLDLYRVFGKSTNNLSAKAERLCSPDQFRCQVRGANLVTRHASNKGIPQGSPISALLSNIYMFDFDREVNSFVKEFNGCYFRYCDDMFLVVPDAFKDVTYSFVENAIGKIKLDLQSKKTERVDFSDSSGQLKSNKPLQYLGFIFDGNQILLRSASLARYSDRMRRGIRLAKSTMLKRNEARKARGDDEKPLFKKKIFNRYTHLGRRNFLSYGYTASKIMQSKAIKRQLGRLWSRVQDEIKS